MCHSSGRPPTSTIGLGRNSVSSRMRVPWPPHSRTTFTLAAVIGTITYHFKSDLKSLWVTADYAARWDWTSPSAS